VREEEGLEDDATGQREGRSGTLLHVVSFRCVITVGSAENALQAQFFFKFIFSQSAFSLHLIS
jgi:hypothetical protein